MLMRDPRFSPSMQLDRQQVMWGLWCSGLEMSAAARVVGFDRKTVYHRIVEAGGIRPRRRQTRARLSFEDRVHIEVALKQGRSRRAIATDLERSPSVDDARNARASCGSAPACQAHIRP